MCSDRKYPVPFVEIDIADPDGSPNGFRRLRGLVSHEFSLFDFIVESGCLARSLPDDASSLDRAEWDSAYGEIDIAEWALYGLIRGVNRNSSLGSSNDRAFWGDILVKGTKTWVRDDLGYVVPAKMFHLASEMRIGRLAVRIGWLFNEGDLIDMALRKVDMFTPIFHSLES